MGVMTQAHAMTLDIVYIAGGVALFIAGAAICLLYCTFVGM
jgi:hypothetical protein